MTENNTSKLKELYSPGFLQAIYAADLPANLEIPVQPPFTDFMAARHAILRFAKIAYMEAHDEENGFCWLRAGKTAHMLIMNDLGQFSNRTMEFEWSADAENPYISIHNLSLIPTDRPDPAAARLDMALYLAVELFLLHHRDLVRQNVPHDEAAKRFQRDIASLLAPLKGSEKNEAGEYRVGLQHHRRAGLLQAHLNEMAKIMLPAGGPVEYRFAFSRLVDGVLRPILRGEPDVLIREATIESLPRLTARLFDKNYPPPSAAEAIKPATRPVAKAAEKTAEKPPAQIVDFAAAAAKAGAGPWRPARPHNGAGSGEVVIFGAVSYDKSPG